MGRTISQIAPVNPKDPNVYITATLDGQVKLRTPGGIIGWSADNADKAAAQIKAAAVIARKIETLKAAAPAGLDEQGLIEYLEKAFADDNAASPQKEGS